MLDLQSQVRIVATGEVGAVIGFYRRESPEVVVKVADQVRVVPETEIEPAG